MNVEGFNSLVTTLDPPMAVVTTANGDERAGCLIGFHSQSSIDPPRYCVWISKANHTHRVLRHSTYMAIHFLTRDDRDLARLFGEFSGDDVDKFAICETVTHESGVPVLARCPFRIIARRTMLLEEQGDHACLIVEAVAASTADGFVALRLSDLADLVPGHEVHERPTPPTERAASR